MTMTRFDEAVTRAEEAHREYMKQASNQLLERIRAAREGREPGTLQFVFWGM